MKLRCAPCNAPMLRDIYSVHFCPLCGALAGDMRPAPSALAEHNDRVPTRMIAEMGAEAATHTWRAANEADAKENR